MPGPVSRIIQLALSDRGGSPDHALPISSAISPWHPCHFLALRLEIRGGGERTATHGHDVPAASGVEGSPTFLAGPQADHVTLEMRLQRVLEVGTAMGELAVIDVLDLAALESELDP